MNHIELKYNEMLVQEQQFKDTIRKLINLADDFDLINGADPGESQQIKELLADSEALIKIPVTTRVAYWERNDE